MKDELLSRAKEFIRLKELKKELDEQSKNLGSRLSEKEKALFHLMFNEDVQSLQVEGKTLYRKVNSYPRIVNEVEFFNWLKENSFENLIKETVHPKTLKSWYKEFSEKNDNATILSEMLQIFEEGGVGVRKISHSN